MKHNLYNELNTDGKVLRQVSITNELAEKLNKISKESGISYEIAKEEKTKTKKQLK